MEEVLKPDLCVIGAGSGGLSVAAAAAQFGVPVVLIEKGRMGGDCLNYGCVPSKALLAAGKRADAVRTASTFGIDVIEAQIDHRGVHDHVHGVIAAIAPNDSIERMTGLGVRVIQAQASFLDKFTVEAGRVLVRARRFVIATGSTPTIPPIPGLDEVPYFTNETIFDVSERIQHLIVLGGGPVGLELGQAHRMLGSHVSVFDIDKLPRRARTPKPPPSCSSAWPTPKSCSIPTRGWSASSARCRASPCISPRTASRPSSRAPTCSSPPAASRTSNRSASSAPASPISDDGIKVNDQLKTTNRRIYAIGDVIGGPAFTHLANYHAGIVIRNALFRLKPDASAGIIPRVVYTDPELAQIGLTEAEARKRYRRIRIYRWPYADNDRAQCERETEGFIKVITRPDGTILGCTIVGAEAGELLQLWVVAMARDIKIGDLTSLVLPYPTLSELSKRVAYTYYLPTLTKGWLRSIIGFLRRLG